MLRPYVFLLGEQLPQPFFHLGIRHRRRACLARRAQQLRMDVRAVGEHWNPAACELADPLRRPRPAELDYREIASGLVPGHIRPGTAPYPAKLPTGRPVPRPGQDTL